MRCSGCSRINRNIVECKAESTRPPCTSSWVLIETLWNVKSLTQRHSKLGQVRINRNIVECKDGFTPNLDDVVIVLIETLWNVKRFRLSRSSASPRY